MKILLSLFLLTISAISFAEQPSVPKALQSTLLKQITPNNYHICHMSNVYLFDRINKASYTKSMVWNNITNSPLLCVDYDPYINCVINNPMTKTGKDLLSACPALVKKQDEADITDKQLQSYLKIQEIISKAVDKKISMYKIDDNKINTEKEESITDKPLEKESVEDTDATKPVVKKS